LDNGHSNIDTSDTSSKLTAPTGWIHSLAGGGGAVAGAGGQSTLSRKSGMKDFSIEFIFHSKSFFLYNQKVLK
jgi:hypothetical protein